MWWYKKYFLKSCVLRGFRPEFLQGIFCVSQASGGNSKHSAVGHRSGKQADFIKVASVNQDFVVERKKYRIRCKLGKEIIQCA